MSQRDRRLTVNLTLEEYAALNAAAVLRDEPAGRTAARLIATALVAEPAAIPSGEPEAPPPVPPPWLEADATVESREAAWTTGEALRERYHGQLEGLPVDWPLAPDLRDGLLALVSWRKDIDAGHLDDPRVELAFQAALRDFRRWIKEQPGHYRKLYDDASRPRPTEW